MSRHPFQVKVNQAPGGPPMVPPVVRPLQVKRPGAGALPGPVLVGLGLGEGLGLGDPVAHWMVTVPPLP